VPAPTRAEVLRQLDLLRGGLRIAITTIRKMKRHKDVDVEAVLGRLETIRADAKEAVDAVRRV
jgi:hypothetical protein